jgi:hypothetical protein
VLSSFKGQGILKLTLHKHVEGGIEMKSRIALLLAVVVLLVALTSFATYALNLGSVIKVGGVAVVVDKFGPQINDFINKLMANKHLEPKDATAVVPILSIGSGGYIGAAQVMGRQENVDKCKAVVQIEGNAMFGGSIRAKALVPVGSKSTKNIQRVEGVGVSAIIDIKI